MINKCEHNCRDLRARKQFELHVFVTGTLDGIQDYVFVSLFFAEFGRHIKQPWCVKYHNTTDHEYKYKTLKEARKAFNNIINSYPDVRVN